MKSHRFRERVVDPLNLWRAWRAFAAGKRRRPSVAAFAVDAERHVLHLADELDSERYRPGAYRAIRITDPKRRLVAAAPVRDRVVHHALHRVMAPVLDRCFSAQSFACLEGRGSHRAVLRFAGELRRFRWVLQLDVARYFYSIDRAILAELLGRRLREPALRRLVGRILASGEGLYRDPSVASFLGWTKPAEPGRGIPIGNLTSQWWANHYLDGLDHFVQRELRPGSYQRYMDDFTLFGDDAGELEGMRDAIAAWLGRERRLELKVAGARPRRATRTHAYLGYRVSRAGIRPGERMRIRARENLARSAEDPERLRSSLASLGTAWMFGS